MIDTVTARAIADDCARESAEKVEAQRLLEEACRVLASIANAPANGNSDPDVMAAALDDAMSNAQTFFRLNGLRIEKYLAPPAETEGEA